MRGASSHCATELRVIRAALSLTPPLPRGEPRGYSVQALPVQGSSDRREVRTRPAFAGLAHGSPGVHPGARGSLGSRRMSSRPGGVRREAVRADGSRVSQPLGTQRLWRPHRPRVLQPHGPRSATAGQAARAVAASISASASSWRTAMGAAVRVGGQRRRGGTRGAHPRGTRARGEGAATSWRDAGSSPAGDAGGDGQRPRANLPGGRGTPRPARAL